MKKKSGLFVAALTAGLLLAPMSAEALKKSETVYTNLDYDGSVIKSSVANHLSFVGNDEIEDATELQNILNLKGDEKFSKNGNTLTWNSHGRDIFYNGIIEKNMPITTSIKYYLNDEEMDVEDIIGKSGRVRIEYRFENENKNNVYVNGRMEVLYTPFLTTVGSILDDSARNVRVTSGKVVSTGSRVVVVGMASPGLYASTGMRELAGFDMVKVEYDTDEFTLGTTYIVSTPKFLEDEDVAFFGKMNTLSKSIDELKENMLKLETGARELEGGANALAQGSSTLSSSLSRAVSSMGQIQSGSVALGAGIDKMIGELEMAKASLQDVTNNPAFADMVLLRSKNDAAVANLASGIMAASPGLSLTDLQTACLDTTGTNPLLANSSVQMFCLLNANNKALDSVPSILSANIDQVLAGLAQVKDGSNSLNAGLTQLSSGLNQIYGGAQSLTAGSRELEVGASTLSAGTTTFKEQGIDKLATTANTYLGYGKRFEALANLSKSYSGFASPNANETVFVSMVKSHK